MERPTQSHVDTHQIINSSTSGEETDDEYIAVSRSQPPDPKKPRPSVQAQNIMTSGLAAALHRTGVSDRNAAYILSEAVSSVGHKFTDFVLSHASARRTRTEYRLNVVQELKKAFSSY